MSDRHPSIAATIHLCCARGRRSIVASRRLRIAGEVVVKKEFLSREGCMDRTSWHFLSPVLEARKAGKTEMYRLPLQNFEDLVYSICGTVSFYHALDIPCVNTDDRFARLQCKGYLR